MNRYIGLMSGTSMDAIDCVLVDFSHDMPRILGTRQTPIEEETRRRLIELSQGTDKELDEFAVLDNRVGHLFAETVIQLLQDCNVASGAIDAIGSHGQTIRHYPPGSPTANSLQIGNPNVIAQRTGITTVGDFRRRDMAAGGQGAPLVPAFHNAVFRSDTVERVVLNIGGIANITILPRDPQAPVSGFDTGPGNLLMDAWTARHRGAAMDRDGAWAASGEVNVPLLRQLLDDAYFHLPPPKSTGREYFNLTWLEPMLAEHPCTAADVQATLCELTARTISQAIEHHAPQTEEILLCGGGIHNKHLRKRLQAHLASRTLASTLEHGIDPDHVEAVAFAWLAKQSLEGKPGNLPSVTGADRRVILGGIYLGGRYKIQGTRYKK
ncbi:MAG TPA: anhydro-N-acetylmuramic acid kinase [Gammaproteobacteria bacterium]|nr:anhydro-N-acetylmuramic acid kinase [Gammaproteobacteria bacterium]